MWAEHRTGDLLYPVTRAAGVDEPGRLGRPVPCGLARGAQRGRRRSPRAPGIHLVTVAALVVLIVVLWRRWPASFTAYTLAAAIVALSAQQPRLARALQPVDRALRARGGRHHRQRHRERVVLTALGAVLVRVHGARLLRV